MEYKAKYVCRLCGGVDCSIGTSNKNLAQRVTILVASTGVDAEDGIPITLHNVHSCPDGSFGISDFQGFVAIAQKDTKI